MKTKKKTWIAMIAVLLGIAISTSYGAVVGDFEGSLDGWVPKDATLSLSPTGATRGAGALQVDGPGGWHIAALLDIKSHRQLLGVPGAVITADVTAFGADMTTTWMQVEMVINAQNNNDAGPNNNIGWRQLGLQSVTRDGQPHTHTWVLPEALTSAIAGTDENIWWFELALVSNLDAASVTKFYIDNIQLGRPAATIKVEAGGDIAAANASAQAGDTIEIAAGTYAITAAIEIKDGVTYKGAGSGQTIIDCGHVTRAFVGWGNRSQNDNLPYSEAGYPDNTSGPKGWVIQGLTIKNGAADNVEKNVRRVGDPAIVPPLTANEILDPFKSTNGGGIILENYAEGTLIDVAFDNCNALATGVDTTDPNLPTTYLGFGGTLRLSWSTANIIDCSFTNNNASNDGGAISATNFDLENLDLTIENSTFINNRARDDGGAIVSVRRNLSIINCICDGNKTGLDPIIMTDNVSGDADGGFLYITGAGKIAGTSYTPDTPPLEMIRYGGVVKVWVAPSPMVRLGAAAVYAPTVRLSSSSPTPHSPIAMQRITAARFSQIRRLHSIPQSLTPTTLTPLWATPASTSTA